MRAALIGLAAAVVVCFGVIQLASSSLDAAAAVPGSLPARIPSGFGLAVYRALDRVAPAPFVEATLARHALDEGDAAAAQRYALRLPPTPARDELLAQVAAARGDDGLAYEYFLAAPDVDAVRARVDAVAGADPARAYAMERTLRVRLELLATHPDAVAEGWFRMGEFAVAAGRSVPAGSARDAWFRRAMRDLDAAVALSPWSDKYAISAANQAVLLGDLGSAQRLFERAYATDPGSADALAGLGVVAYRRGDVVAARADLQRARALDPNSGMVRALTSLLGAAPGAPR